MKKFVCIVMAGMLILSLTACGSKKKEEPATAGAALFEVFQEKAGNDISAEELANEIISQEMIPFAGMAMAVEPGYLTGFTEEISGFAEGATFGPMIGSIPFVGYVFYLEDGADVEAFVKNLKDKGDLRWNICTEADEMVCDAVGNKVFFVMCPTDLGE